MGQMRGEARQESVCSAVCIVGLTYIYPVMRWFPKHSGEARAERGCWAGRLGKPGPSAAARSGQVHFPGASRQEEGIPLRHHAHHLLPRRRLSSEKREGPQVLSASFSNQYHGPPWLGGGQLPM